MEATSGRLIASTSRYPLSFDHRSIAIYPLHDARPIHETKARVLTAQRQYPILFGMSKDKFRLRVQRTQAQPEEDSVNEDMLN